jgi:death-on-curing protein
MNVPTIEEILFIHYNLILRLQGENGPFGLLNPGQLEAAVAKVNQTVGGKETYEQYWDRAAALAEAIIRLHPFQDGNKRVGITVGCVLLMINGLPVWADDDKIYEAAMGVAEGRWEFKKLRDWFEYCTM